MQKIAKMTVAVASSLSIAAAGLAGVAGASSIDTTGPHSWNNVKNSSSYDSDVKNNNTATVANTNDQDARTGRAGVSGNTTGGDATSGNASNSNDFSADLSVDNSSCDCAAPVSGSGGEWGGEISNTGPKSDNVIENKQDVKVRVTNNNNVVVSNTNDQSASSGDASVDCNTTGGNATSGDASNTNSSSVTLSINN